MPDQFIDVGKVSQLPGLLEALRTESAEFAGPFQRMRQNRPQFRPRRNQAQAAAPQQEEQAEQLEEETTVGASRVDVRPNAARPPVQLPGVLMPDYGPHTQISPNVRLQTQRGTRAAVINLGPGLTLVAEVPSSACHPVLGLDPVLTPLLINAAASALSNPQVQQGFAQAGQGVVHSFQQAFRPHPQRPQPPMRPPLPHPPLPPHPPRFQPGPPPPWAQSQWEQPAWNAHAHGPMMMVGYQPPPTWYPGPQVHEMPPVQQSPFGWNAPPAFGCEGCNGRCQGAFGGDGFGGCACGNRY